MKQNSRKKETDKTDNTGLDGNQDKANYPINSSNRTPGNLKDNIADDAAQQDNNNNTNEVTRDPEGRPGSFGIDDF